MPSENDPALGLDNLDALVAPLAADAPIRVVEEHEERLKRVLGAAFERGVTPDEGRRIAAFQRDVGLIMKYKPYAVKAATPLGFSIFLQEPGQGFSFQKHSVRKVEAFHVLEANEGGYVFLCSYADWQRAYEPERFQRWLDGAPDDGYDRFRIVPSVGDVYLITDRETVHTVIGCQIEEYASVSVDVVQRLHDQNRATPIPKKFKRRFALERIGALRQPAQHRAVQTDGHISPVQQEQVSSGVSRAMLVDCPELQATVWKLAPGTRTAPMTAHRDRGVSLYVSAGHMSVLVGDEREVSSGATTPIAVDATGVTMVAPGLSFAILNDGKDPLTVSMHSVAWRPAMRTLDA